MVSLLVQDGVISERVKIRLKEPGKSDQNYDSILEMELLKFSSFSYNTTALLGVMRTLTLDIANALSNNKKEKYR